MANNSQKRPVKRGNAAHVYERKRADGTAAYRVMFRIDGAQVGETFHTPAGAEEFRRLVNDYGGEQAREILRSRQGQDDERPPTVAEWCRTYVEERSGITIGTRRDYLDIISRHIAGEPIGKFPVDALAEKHVTAWLRTQEALGASGKSMRNRHGLLSAAMNYAVRRGVARANPCEGHKVAKTARQAMTFLTHSEFAILLTHMPARWHPLTVLLAGTGMRFSEATALHVGNLHLDDDVPTLRVEQAWKWTDNSDDLLGPPKTERGRRTISLPPEIVDIIRPLLKGKSSDDLVFTRAGGGRVRNVDYREDGWMPALKKATAEKDKTGKKIPTDQRLTKRPRIHDLRHSHVSWMLAAGVDLTVLQARLGHESIKTTVDTYGHLHPDTQKRAADASSLALSQALPELAPAQPPSEKPEAELTEDGREPETDLE